MFWLDADDLAAISPGDPKTVRDWKLLEGAAARPRMGFGDYEGFPELVEKAAALLHGICSSHPFVDGNKRTAWLAALVFLKLNGILVEAEEDEAVELVVSVAEGTIDISEIAAWLEAHSHHLD